MPYATLTAPTTFRTFKDVQVAPIAIPTYADIAYIVGQRYTGLDDQHEALSYAIEDYLTENDLNGILDAEITYTTLNASGARLPHINWFQVEQTAPVAYEDDF